MNHMTKIIKKMARLMNLARKTRTRKENSKITGPLGSTTKPLPNWYREIGNWRKRPWEDHLSTEGTFVFSEPYKLSMADCKALIAFCEERNLNFKITGLSSYYPGRTVLVIITRTERRKKA